jgi:opacity protein-like surface antigen
MQMKRILLGITLLSFMAAVHAQKKPKAAAPAPAATAKPAPAAPAAPVAPAAPTASGADESKLLVGVWGGYGFAGSSEFTKYPNDKFISDSQFIGSWSAKSDNKLGGVAGGLNLLYGSAFQYGIGLSYVTGMDNKTTHTTGANTVVIATKVNYVPVYAQIRYFIIDGLYVGAGVGIASVVGSSQKITGDATAAVDYSGSQIVGVGKIGYDFKLSNSLSIGVVAGFYYFSGKIPVIFYDANNDPKTKDVDASHLNIVPSLAVTMAF